MSDILKDFDKKNEIPRVKLDFPKLDSPKVDFSGIDNALKKLGEAFDDMVKDIRERQDNAMAMEFTKCIGELLKKNGVVPKISEYRMENHAENHAENKIEMRYGVNIDELDFSEHDKVFEDKIANLEKENKDLKNCFAQREKDSTDMIMKLKQEKADKNEKIAELACENESLKRRRAELESKETVDLPFDPLETANYLINSTYERETNGIERTFHNLPDKVNSDRYTVDELEQIAEHLLVYCKHNKESE